jgi:hypothetical protein
MRSNEDCLPIFSVPPPLDAPELALRGVAAGLTTGGCGATVGSACCGGGAISSSSASSTSESPVQ